MNKLFKAMLSLFLAFTCIFSNNIVHAEETTELAVKKIVAHTRVSDSGKAVYSFEITVNDATFIEGISAEDFEITNNGSNIPLRHNGSAQVPYEEDGIEIAVKDNVITLKATPFNYAGTGGDWKVTSEKFPALTFNKNNVTEITTDILDEAIRGEFTYGGLTREYALYIPANATGPVPLVVWNHGGGEYAKIDRDTRQLTWDIEATLTANNGLTAWPEAGYETAVLMFQISNENFGYHTGKYTGNNDFTPKQKLIDQNNALQAAFIKQLIAEGKVDENRVYVTGASSGGGATLRFVMQYPEMFAGAIAMCSMDPIEKIHNNRNETDDQIVEKLKAAFQGKVWTWDEETSAMVEKEIDTQALIDLPIYFAAAERDGIVNSRTSKVYYRTMQELGDTNNKLAIWSDEEMLEYDISGVNNQLLHWSWVRVFNDKSETGQIAWLFNQEKPHLEVEKIVANTRVGDSGKELHSFEITVNDATFIEGITAEDFEITNNGSCIPLQLNGQNQIPYVEDGITVTVKDNVITLSATPFNYAGTGGDWKVTSEKFPALTFNKSNVDEIKTNILDEAIYGEFTYAGLTRKYALYIPENATGPVPLVVWNHGGGEYEYDIKDTLVANRGLTAWPEAGYETAVLMFQISNENFSYHTGTYTGDDDFTPRQKLIDQNNALQAEFIRQLIEDGTVDENRVYVTGSSSGGGATLRFVMQYPEMFAGAIANCAMDPIEKIHNNRSETDDQIVEKLKAAFQGKVWTWDEETSAMVEKEIDTQALIDLPIYFAAAENDGIVNSRTSKVYYRTMQELGDTNDVLTIWSDAEMAEYGIGTGYWKMLLHWSWVRVFNDTSADGLMAWLFDQTNVTNLVVKLEEAVAELEETYTLESVEDAEAIIEAVKAVKELNATEAQIERLDAVVEKVNTVVEEIEEIEEVIESIQSIPATFEPDNAEVNVLVETIVEAYEALSDTQKALVSEEQVTALNKAVSQLTNYEFTSGKNGSWVKGEKDNLKFVVNALFSKFKSVYVDNQLVDSKNYTAKAGSTIIELKPSYLETLKEGKHTMTIKFEDKDMTTEFTIQPKVETQTGDNANIMLYGALLVVSTLSVAYFNRKRALKSK